MTTLGSLKILDVFCRIGAWRLSQHSFHFSHRHRNWSSPRRISNGSLDQKISPSTFPPGPFGPCHLSPEAHNSTDATGRSEPPWRFTFCRTLGVGHINQVFTISPLDADFGAEKVFPLIGGGQAVFCSVEFPEVRVPAEVWELLGMKQSWWTMVDSFTSFSGRFLRYFIPKPWCGFGFALKCAVNYDTVSISQHETAELSGNVCDKRIISCSPCGKLVHSDPTPKASNWHEPQQSGILIRLKFAWIASLQTLYTMASLHLNPR